MTTALLAQLSLAELVDEVAARVRHAAGLGGTSEPIDYEPTAAPPPRPETQGRRCGIPLIRTGPGGDYVREANSLGQLLDWSA